MRASRTEGGREVVGGSGGERQRRNKVNLLANINDQSQDGAALVVWKVSHVMDCDGVVAV